MAFQISSAMGDIIFRISTRRSPQSNVLMLQMGKENSQSTKKSSSNNEWDKNIS